MSKINPGHPPKQQIDIEARVAICRCWQSKKFPYCDGSHHKFNAENNEDLGPIIIETVSD